MSGQNRMAIASKNRGDRDNYVAEKGLYKRMQSNPGKRRIKQEEQPITEAETADEKAILNNGGGGTKRLIIKDTLSCILSSGKFLLLWDTYSNMIRQLSSF